MMKPHLSNSQLEMYARCPEQYRRRYIEGEIKPPGVSMLLGSGVHKAAEHNWRQKIESHEDRPLAELIDAGTSYVRDSMTQGGMELTAEERSRGIAAVANELMESTKAAVTGHWSLQAPNYQPKEVEVSTRIELPSFSRDLLCITDMRDTSDRVVDLKTSQKKKPADSAKVSTQLTLYAVAFQHDHGKLPASLRFDVIVLSGAAPTRQVLKTKREPEDLPPLVARINAVVDSIEKGSFPPTSPTNWWCSAKFCGYFETCRYVRHSPQTHHEDSHVHSPD